MLLEDDLIDGVLEEVGAHLMCVREGGREKNQLDGQIMRERERERSFKTLVREGGGEEGKVKRD